MNTDDGIARIELSGEETLLLESFQVVTDLFGKTSSLFFQFRGYRLAVALLGRHLKHRLEVPHLCGQMIEILQPIAQPAVLGADGLSVILVVPEVGGPHPLLE